MKRIQNATSRRHVLLNIPSILLIHRLPAFGIRHIAIETKEVTDWHAIENAEDRRTMLEALDVLAP